VIDPAVPVTDWSLTPAGTARVTALTGRLPRDDIHVVSSAERKALETAWPMAARLGTAVEVRPAMHENDRSATGFLPVPEFEETANAFFANPEQSIRGWEAAADAQARILREVAEVLATQPSRSLIFAGHGGVGTLLLCALAGRPIGREWDQKGSGHWFAFDPGSRRALTDWAPLESLFA
jgi:broad specificity phosphatase PhoE